MASSKHGPLHISRGDCRIPSHKMPMSATGKISGGFPQLVVGGYNEYGLWLTRQSLVPYVFFGQDTVVDALSNVLAFEAYDAPLRRWEGHSGGGKGVTQPNQPTYPHIHKHTAKNSLCRVREQAKQSTRFGCRRIVELLLFPPLFLLTRTSAGWPLWALRSYLAVRTFVGPDLTCCLLQGVQHSGPPTSLSFAFLKPPTILRVE